MTARATAMLAGDQRPYEVAMRLLGDLGPVLQEADYAGAASYEWGCLTDGIDGPPRYARGLTEAEIEELMRQAASEWLKLEPTQANLETYFERWNGWPESVAL